MWFFFILLAAFVGGILLQTLLKNSDGWYIITIFAAFTMLFFFISRSDTKIWAVKNAETVKVVEMQVEYAQGKPVFKVSEDGIRFMTSDKVENYDEILFDNTYERITTTETDYELSHRFWRFKKYFTIERIHIPYKGD